MILMVSFNDGVFYHEFMESDDLEVLLKGQKKWMDWMIYHGPAGISKRMVYLEMI